MYNKRLCFRLYKYIVFIFGNSACINVGLGAMQPWLERMESQSHGA